MYVAHGKRGELMNNTTDYTKGIYNYSLPKKQGKIQSFYVDT